MYLAPYFYFEWDSQLPEPTAHVTGPLCEAHKRLLRYEGKRGVGQHAWACVNPDKKNDRHDFTLSHDSVTMQHIARKEANVLLRQRLAATLTQPQDTIRRQAVVLKFAH